MSQELKGGGLYVKDPDAERVLTWTWDDELGDGVEIATSDFEVDGPDADLTFDNDSIGVDGRTASLRLIGGTVGAEYTVTHRIVTNETPPQTDDESISVLIQQT